LLEVAGTPLPDDSSKLSSHDSPLDASTVNKFGLVKEEKTTAKEIPPLVDSMVIDEEHKEMDRSMSGVIDETHKDHLAPVVSTKMTAGNEHLEADLIHEHGSDADDDVANSQDISASSEIAIATPSTAADADQLLRTGTNFQDEQALPDSSVRAEDCILSASGAAAAITPEENSHEKIEDANQNEVHGNSPHTHECPVIDPTENFVDASGSAAASEEQPDTEVADGSAVGIEMTESRFCLQHGFEELEDVNHAYTGQVKMTSEASAVGFETMESRFHLQHESDDVVEEILDMVVECHDSGRSEVLEQGGKEEKVAQHESTLEAVAICTLAPVATHGDDDASRAIDNTNIVEVEMTVHHNAVMQDISLKEDEPTLEVDILRLCEIALNELAIHHDTTGKVSEHAIQALQHIQLYGRDLAMHEAVMVEDVPIQHATATALDAFASTMDTDNCTTNPTEAATELIEPEQTHEDATDSTDMAGDHQQQSVPEPEIVLDGATGSRMTFDDALTHQTFLGLIPVADLLDRLSNENAVDGIYTKRQVVRTFASMSNQERELCGLDAVNNATKDILRSTTLQYTTRIGRTKMSDFLALVDFDGGSATMDMVTEACMKAAHEELAFRKSPASRKIARAVAMCMSARN
jgi:hypothetical protein